MEAFKKAAMTILGQAGGQLHYREITQKALDQKLIVSEGRTPWATMNAELSTDIITNGEKSVFVRADPGFYALRTLQISVDDHVTAKAILGKARIVHHEINADINTKQKGDIAEARVAELITLYGKEGLSCYKPTSRL
jgi:hypothetical protein